MSRLGQNSWVVFFCSMTLFAHAHFLKEKKGVVSHLQTRLEKMEIEKQKALEMKRDLELRIASEDDPAWIEMVLMRDLGVVPEGFLKVHFKK